MSDEWVEDLPDSIEEPLPAPLYKSLPEFVEKQIVYMYIRNLEASAGFRWCPEWFNHPEVVARFTAMWRAFEALRADPGTGASVMWVQHWDPHMRTIMGPDGPLWRCSVERGHQAKSETPLPVAEPPEGMFEVYS